MSPDICIPSCHSCWLALLHLKHAIPRSRCGEAKLCGPGYFDIPGREHRPSSAGCAAGSLAQPPVDNPRWGRHHSSAQNPHVSWLAGWLASLPALKLVRLPSVPVSARVVRPSPGRVWPAFSTPARPPKSRKLAVITNMATATVSAHPDTCDMPS